MRAMLLQKPGGEGEALSLVDIARPEPGPGDVLVEVAYCGCNFADTMMRKGTYPHPKGYPIVAGLEIAGRVVALGPDVTTLAIGDRVAAFSEEAGGFADFCTVPAERCVVLPEAIGFDTGAAFLVQGLTAWHMLHTVSTTKPGDTLLVHAIGGGVGLYLTQLGVLAGARVIGTIGTAGKEKRPLDYGAALVVNRAERDFVAAIEEFAGKDGIDKIVDSTGATILDQSFALIRKLGHIVSYGEAEGKPFPNLWERLVRKSLTFTRFHLGHSNFQSPEWRAGAAFVTGAIADGSLAVPIEAVFPFAEVGAMYDRLESRTVSGKLLLAVQPGL
ncbi:quinone oxidoreductase family protein [Prosthecomicrobium pneumaticum]|uniref:NADPH2:quinone reductase n=1 Tax=Prosthecomicrobium pneumaticum TaxID=81895 RepID=A0A7W9CVB5_9HYPH|nr:zinc-binding dehydrogenase [Prosthecomicrobium pneumaticum]MBB5752253.1 NADPH2:quinone reductase [Prosthecomicrobium pneumaticum]